MSVIREGVRHFEIDDDHAGQRLDNFLIARLPGVPKSRIYRALRRGEVRVDGRRARPTHRLQVQQRVRIPPLAVVAKEGPQATGNSALGTRLLNGVIAETEDWLALDKPSGVASHGGSGIALGAVEALRGMRGGFLELVHRLDRDTSGVLLLAKRRSALLALQDAFRRRSTVKTYLMIVHGCWRLPEKVEVRQPLQRYLTPNGERRVRVAHSGKAAHSTFELLSQATGVSSLRVTLHTGRTHQARVHALSCGHPIVGDSKYLSGEAQANAVNAPRLMLHASRLVLPYAGERLKLAAPVPPEMRAFASQHGISMP